MQGADLAWALCIWAKAYFNTWGPGLLEGSSGPFGLAFKLLEHMDTHKMLNTLARAFVQCLSGLVFLCFARFNV